MLILILSLYYRQAKRVTCVQWQRDGWWRPVGAYTSATIYHAALLSNQLLSNIAWHLYQLRWAWSNLHLGSHHLSPLPWKPWVWWQPRLNHWLPWPIPTHPEALTTIPTLINSKDISVIITTYKGIINFHLKTLRISFLMDKEGQHRSTNCVQLTLIIPSFAKHRLGRPVL